MLPISGRCGVDTGYWPVSYTFRIAPRDFRTAKWLLSTVSRLPFMMSLAG